MNVFHTIADYKAWRRSLPAGARVGFVPTMGALHEGHATLLRRACEDSGHSVLSIFVNPTQFGPNEDLEKYPKTWEKDLEIARREGVRAVFAPDAQEIYPSGFSTFVEEGFVSVPLCGKFRPGHFRGVATVVLKLLNIVEPTHAYFGLKDAQQFFVIKKMVSDLSVNVQLIGVPTVREKDGLAMSSRNAYLSSADRARAAKICHVLEMCAGQLEGGLDASGILSEGGCLLKEAGFDVQYLELRTLPEFEVAARFLPDRAYLLAVAAFLGGTRLIDNKIIRPDLL